MTVVDYENLLNRGWRRSGKYLYKPTNNMTCCPCYTIKCDALEFKLSKSQKKVLKRFNKYLIEGDLKANTSSSQDDMESSDDRGVQEIVNLRRGSVNLDNILPIADESLKDLSTEAEVNTGSTNRPRKLSKKESLGANMSNSSGSKGETPATSGQSESDLPKSRKAKDIRREKRRQKLLAKGIDPESVMPKTLGDADAPKSIEDFIKCPEQSSKKLTIKIVRSGTEEFMKTFEDEHQLYRKYQIVVHGDDEDECTKKQFKRFLCDSPLVVSFILDSRMFILRVEFRD